MSTELRHLDAIYGPGETLGPSEAIFIVESPIESPRVSGEYIARLEQPLSIDGGLWEATMMSCCLPATGVSIGERVALRCRRLRQDGGSEQ